MLKISSDKKLYLTFLIYSFIIIFSFIIVNKLLFGSKHQEILMHNAKNEFISKEMILQDFLGESKNQLFSIYDSSLFKEYIKNKNIETIKPLFTAIAKSSHLIMQIRYINKDGQELIRLDRKDINSEPFEVKDSELQNKSTRYYFKDSKNKELEKVWFSKLDLNIENNKLQTPYNPTIRAVLPTKKDDKFSGIIIINYFMAHFTEIFDKTEIYNLLLIDSNGFYLKHYKKEKDWGFYKEGKYNIKNELPNKANKILNSKIYEDEEIYSRKLDLNMQNELILILQTNEEYVNKLNSSLLKEYSIVSIIILFIGYFSLLIIKNVFKELSTELEKTDLKLKESSNIAKLSFWILDLKTMKLKFDHNWFNMLAFKQNIKEIDFEQLAKFEKNNKSLKKLSEAISNMDENSIIEFYMNDIYSKEVHFLAKFKIIKDEYYIAKEIEITVQNITEQKQLIKSLLKAKKDAELASEAKSRFLANMSHEIRTPLNGIIGLTDLALKTDSITKQKEFLKKSKISSAALLNVINDILDHSKIVAGKLSLEQKDFNLDEVLLNITNLFDYQAYQKGIDLHIKIDPKIPFVLKGDALRISQIFNNLIGNAIKFTQKGYVNISIDLKEISNTKVKIICTVEDSGIGISKENQKKLFKSFEQVDSSNTRIYGGTGLGLTITKDLVSLMNGNIYIESEENKGSSFIFTIDLDYDDSINYNLSSKDIFKAKTFLIVVSCSIDRKILETILNSWKIDVISCKDVQEALILSKDRNIDYLVVDYLMPEMNGLDVIQKLKEELKINSLNIVMATLFKEKEILQKAKKQNITIEKIVHKPFTSSSLFDSIITSKKRIHGISKDNDIKSFKINANVLLVEDNAINQIVTKEYFTSFGLDVDIASNGLEAVKMARINTYDIIFMDLQMPIMDGFEASLKIKEFLDIPIVALSAAVMNEDKILSKNAGMDYHIPKPMVTKDLINILKLLLPEKVQINNEEIKEVDNSTCKLYGVDIKSLINRVKNKDLAFALLDTFIEDYEEFNLEINESENKDNLNELIHKLKGVSGNLSIFKIYDLCLDIQKSDYSNKRLIDKLLEELDKTIFSLKQRTIQKEEVSIKYNDDEIGQVLDEVLQLLSKNSFISFEKVTKLSNVLESITSLENKNNILSKIKTFEYKEAIEEIKKLKENLNHI